MSVTSVKENMVPTLLFKLPQAVFIPFHIWYEMIWNEKKIVDMVWYEMNFLFHIFFPYGMVWYEMNFFHSIYEINMESIFSQYEIKFFQKFFGFLRTKFYKFSLNFLRHFYRNFIVIHNSSTAGTYLEILRGCW